MKSQSNLPNLLRQFFRFNYVGVKMKKNERTAFLNLLITILSNQYALREDIYQIVKLLKKNDDLFDVEIPNSFEEYVSKFNSSVEFQYKGLVENIKREYFDNGNGIDSDTKPLIN